MNRLNIFAIGILASARTLLGAEPAGNNPLTPENQRAISNLLAGRFNWTVGPPLISPTTRPEDPCISMKDPSIVRFGNRWHLFCTIRSQKRSHQIEYLSFDDWKDADAAARRVLKISDGYFCAPQVFYFSPQHKWYLIFQTSDPSRKPALQPVWSTTTNLADP